MRSLCKVCLTLAVAALVAGPALAQRQPGGRGFSRGGISLLANTSVQEELKLTDEQKKKVEAVAEKSQTKMREAFQKLRDLDREQRAEKFRALFSEMNAENEKAVAGILKPEQMKRYQQINRQQMGLRAFTDEEIQKELKFTAEQKEAVTKIYETYNEKRRELRRPGGNREEARAAREKLETETMGQIASKLTADQKKAWKEMTGEKFEIRRERRRPGGGRPGGDRPPRVDF